MIDEGVLDGLLVLALVLSVILVLISSAATGRRISDLEYQREAGLNGIRKIQAHINIRAHLGRVLLGLLFIVVTVLLLADAPMHWRTVTYRTLYAALLLYFVVSAVLDWLGDRQQMKLTMADDASALATIVASAARATASQAAVDSYRSMADEAVKQLEDAANTDRATHGLDPLEVLAAVVPEHNSPVTEQQAETAAVATMRARLTAASLSLGVGPKPADETPKEKPR